MKICPYCNHENSNKEKWCCFCGRPCMDVRPLDTRHQEEARYQHQPNRNEGIGGFGETAMICSACPHRKQLDALEVMDGAPDWVCDMKHSECEDIICLTRMMIWQLYHLEDLLCEEEAE